MAGPYSLNGVPLKRVNQRYCIATSTKVDLGAAEAWYFYENVDHCYKGVYVNVYLVVDLR